MTTEHRRRYGDKEVGLILKRAAELQRLEPASGPEGSGLTVAELEEIAAEAGIDPAHLRRAAEEFEAAGAGLHAEGSEKLVGAPLTIRLERSLPGELSESGFERLVPEIQRVADGHGQASLLGQTLTWRSISANSERSLQVTVSSRNGRTRILIEERLSQLAGQLFGGIIGGVGGGVGLGVGLGVGIGALQSVAFAVAWPVGVVGGAYLLARTIYRSTARRRQRTLRNLLEGLTAEIESLVGSRHMVPGSQPPGIEGSG
jgi:hypothetical protein